MKIDYVKDFEKLLSSISRSRNNREVFEDFICLAAYSISNSCDRSPVKKEREARYHSILSKYKNCEKKFSELLAILVLAYEANSEQDFLGHFYMMNGYGNSRAGQFFTPYNICKMIAEMSWGGDAKSSVDDKGYIVVGDPCVGSGGLLIAARNRFEEIGVSSWQVWFEAQDISYTVSLMAYIQLSLLGVAGVVTIADSLRYPNGVGLSPEERARSMFYTPLSYMDMWKSRRIAKRMDDVIRKANSSEQEGES